MFTVDSEVLSSGLTTYFIRDHWGKPVGSNVRADLADREIAERKAMRLNKEWLVPGTRIHVYGNLNYYAEVNHVKDCEYYDNSLAVHYVAVVNLRYDRYPTPGEPAWDALRLGGLKFDPVTPEEEAKYWPPKPTIELKINGQPVDTSSIEAQILSILGEGK